MSHHPLRIDDCFLTRRQLLGRSAMGFAMLGLASLLADNGLLAAGTDPNPLALKKPHFPAKAKRVVHLFMNGGASHAEPLPARNAGRRSRPARPTSPPPAACLGSPS